MSLPIRSVLTGGPGAGKSTLLEAMHSIGCSIFPEAAREILKTPGGRAMRVSEPMQFAMAMLEADMCHWQAAGPGISFFDRGFPDIVGFLNLGSLPVPKRLDHICREYRYDGPIFRAHPWDEIYVTDNERTQNWEQAVASDEAVASAWHKYGYELIDLPFASVATRVDFAMTKARGGEPT